MNDPERISTLKDEEEKTPIPARIGRIFSLVVFSSLFGLIGLVIWQMKAAGGKSLLPVLPFVFLLALFAVIAILIGIRKWLFHHTEYSSTKDDLERISTLQEKEEKTPILLRVARVFFLVVVFSLLGLIGLVVWQAKAAGGKGIEPLLPLIALLASFSIIPLMIWMFKLIQNERIAYYGVLIALSLIVYGGILTLEKNSGGFEMAMILSVFLSLFFMFRNISLWILALFGGLLFFAFCWQGIPLIVLFINSHELSNPHNPYRGISPSNVSVFFSYMLLALGCLLIALACLLIALAYAPRGIDWQRYFFPYRNRPLFPDNRRKRGFTLIEMLISIALIGITAGGVLHCWSTILRTQNELQIRTHAAEILHSEMNALMTKTEIPAPSTEGRELPIKIQEFVTPYRFTGDYLIEASDEPGIVKITTRLTQKIDESNERHFRLVGYRRCELDKQP